MTKRGPIMKHLAKTLLEWPPQNFAPWKRPNRRVQKVIDDKIVGRLEDSMADTEQFLLSRFLERKLKGGR